MQAPEHVGGGGENSARLQHEPHHDMPQHRRRGSGQDEGQSGAKGGARVKMEDDSATSLHGDDGTRVHVGPAQTNGEADISPADTSLEPGPAAGPSKKRKRAPSPPWTFPTADTTTLKTADGRRVSARFNASTSASTSTSTPGISDSDAARGRSSSLSAPPANLTAPNSAPRSRAASPPWKPFEPAGPSSVLVDGKRKSGRVNKEVGEPPRRVSPRSAKKIDAKKMDARPSSSPSSMKREVDGGHMPERKLSFVLSPNRKKMSGSRRESQAIDHNTTIAQLQAQIKALGEPLRSFDSSEQSLSKSSHKRKHSAGNNITVRPTSPKLMRAPLSPETHRPSPKIRLRLSRRVIDPPHPNAKLPLPSLPPRLSIFQVVEHHELRELQHPYIDNDRGPPDMPWFRQRAEAQAAEEGVMRRRLLTESHSGGILSKERSSIYQNADPQPEPLKQYGHLDHLTAHALHLRHLQVREQTAHRQLAKKVAHEAVEFWKSRRGPTEEDLREEAERVCKLVYRQVVVDMRAKWEMVAQYVRQRRVKEWEAKEDERRQARLREKLESAQAMIARQRGGEEDDGLSEALDSDEDDGSGSEESESGEENMSESSEEEGQEEEEEQGSGDAEMGEDELAAYLAQRAAEPPDRVDEDDDGQLNISLADMLSPGERDASVNHEPAAEDQTSRADDDDVSMAAASDSPVMHSDSEPPQDTMAALFADDQMDDDQDAPDQEFQPEPTPEHVDDAASEHEHTDAERHSTRRSRRSSMSPTTAAEGEEGDFSSDESTDMDSTDYDSDEDMSSTGDEAEANADDDDGDEGGGDASGDERPVPKNSLLSLFKDEVKKWAGLPTPTTSAEGDGMEHAAQVETEAHDEEQANGGARVEESATVVEGEDKRQDSIQDLPKTDENEIHDVRSSIEPEAPTDAATKHLIASPALLRGTLRSYQHAGLDWLASLYRAGTNGILADEMGLGKTIQTIALLAHLAEEHEVWEAHLVIVPTSVILNWVTEFQKFLPGFRVLGYYGTAEERQAKRRGWVNDPHHVEKDKRGYNVVVTSYNVAMQDINAIRNVQWHYLVLDEAHNIRNFQSQRWQVLIRLKTRARLLLTGTPLQNSLTELWSLLTFLTAGDDDPQHGDLEEFLSHWKEPVREIFDRGVATLSAEAQRVVEQLHISLRPFLLRRLKSEVEKDLPTKTEEVVVCKLSKRQRQLYQEYMGLAETRRSLQQGNAVSAGKVLLSLRRVCNHPDLFDPRPVQTSFALEGSAVEGFAGVEQLVRGLLGVGKIVPSHMAVRGLEALTTAGVKRRRKLNAHTLLQKEMVELQKEANDEHVDPGSLAGCRAIQRVRVRQQKLEHLRSCIAISTASMQATPVYGIDLRELVTVKNGGYYQVSARDSRGRVIGKALRGWPQLGQYPLRFDNDHPSDWLLSQTSFLQRSIPTVETYAARLHPIISRFAFCTPTATAPILPHIIPGNTQDNLRASSLYPLTPTDDSTHDPRTRLSIAFPDPRLLIYDSGKLQRLTVLLRQLQSQQSRSLIFTQMTGTLNILETFLSLLSLPYLRLDGSTPVERRALYAAEFNRPDSKYQCMILSSRAGGVGLNLTGASSVIFYDLDWNPQMDRQCMDRAHRIGQVRDVRVFKMVSERTVEENILRRAEQKSLLDRAVIQEGHFTTEHRDDAPTNVGDEEEGDEDVENAINRFLGSGGDKTSAAPAALDSVEDAEDVAAASAARKEMLQDEVEFSEQRSSHAASRAVTPGAGLSTPAEGDGEVEEGDGREGHVDFYMVRLMEREMQGLVFLPPAVPRTGDAARRRDRKGRKKR